MYSLDKILYKVLLHYNTEKLVAFSLSLTSYKQQVFLFGCASDSHRYTLVSMGGNDTSFGSKLLTSLMTWDVKHFV